MRERELFIECLQRENPAERGAFLDVACAGDEALRQRVDRLLEEHARPEHFILDSPPPGVATTTPPEMPGSIIGPYKLLEQIGEGGMGVVFMADQQSPVRRKVAVKIVKPGMDSRQVIARFEAERQALALMDHPHIAHVFDAGTTAEGRPYFVMELVKGVPITQYCDDHQLTPRERLELFLPVCHAIQHAHQKGIIHRDLKPSNVLVADYDEQPVAKVIDFGVAKAIGEPLTEKTLFTSLGQMVGTIDYMSPEQAKLNQLDVDTRSDVYSLGVLLYELLTGSTPHDRKRLRDAAFDDMLRIVREEEPVKPSTRLFSSPTLDAVAAKRQISATMLTRLVRGELDWIVMKALEKDRNRRYETANGLARDIERYLNNEAVHACPPSAAYRFAKFVRRNVVAFVLASVIGLSIVLAAVGLAVSNHMIRQEQARTNDQMLRAEHARSLAEERAEEVRQGLERLKAANAWLERGRWHLDQRRWDDANTAYTRAVSLRPDHAAAWLARGDLFALLGLWDLASVDFARDFELREPDTTIRWYRHALLRLSLGDEVGYRQICHRMCERFRGTISVHFATELIRTCAISDSANVDFQPLVEMAERSVRDEPGSWFRLYILGMALYRAGDYENAAAQLQASFAADTVWTGRAMGYPILAMARHRQGRIAEARQALTTASEAIDLWTKQRYSGATDGRWVVDQGATVNWPIAWWDWLECEVYYREAKLLIDGTAPREDPRLHVLRARSFAGLRRHSTADAEYAAALRLLPNDKQILLEAHRSAGYSAIAQRRGSRAADEFTQASELSPDDSKLWQFRALAQLGAGDVDGYRQACAAMVKRFADTMDPRIAGDVIFTCALRDDALADPARLLSLANVSDSAFNNGPYVRGAALYRVGQFTAAIECFETAARMHRPRAWEWSFLAMSHHRLGHADEARRCLAEAVRWIDAANRQTEVDASETKPAWGEWKEQIVFPHLVREAETLIGGNE